MSSHDYFQKRDFSERKCTALRGGFNEPLVGAVSSRGMSGSYWEMGKSPDETWFIFRKARGGRRPGESDL